MDEKILTNFNNCAEKIEFADIRYTLKIYFSNLLKGNKNSQNIFVKEIEPTGFNRLAYNRNIPLAEINLDDIR